MNLQKFCLITLCVIAFFSGNAQESLNTSYIVTHTGDTIKGYINHKNRDRNPKTIVFKKDDTNTEEYSPLAIGGFTVSGNYYESAIVDFESSPTDLKDVDRDSELHFKKDTVFLQRLIDGPKNLYAYYIGSDNEQFYIKKGKVFELLAHKKFMRTNGQNSLFLISNTLYLNQLNAYCNDCSKTTNYLKGLKYKRTDLVNFFEKYYKCVGQKMKLDSELERIVARTGVIMGYTLTDFSIEGETYSKFDFSKSSSVSGGLYFDLKSSKKFLNFSLYNELFVSTYKFDGVLTDFENEQTFTTVDYTLAYAYLKINNMIRYHFNGGGVEWFVNAGIGNGYAISETNKATITKSLFGIQSTREDEFIEGTKKLEQSLLFGLGGKIKKYSYEFRVEHGNGITAGSGNDVDRVHILVGYRF
jgi:hypothetical protein